MDESERKNALEAIKELQDFDVGSLVREDELGRKFAFSEALKPATRLQALFRQISLSHAAELPAPQLRPISEQARFILDKFRNIEEFDPKKIDNPDSHKQSLISEINDSYDGSFERVWHQIAYLSSRERDFGAMEVEARSVVEEIREKAKNIITDLEKRNDEASQILQNIRNGLAEQGVSQHAIHFKNEAEHHRDQAAIWFNRTLFGGVVLIAYSVLSLFFHHIPGALGSGSYGMFQLATSKFLIFAILTYLLLLSAKNYMSHRHNEVVNRHRQNALATFTALADATSNAASSDVVLSHAAACIFSPQETGLTKQDISGPDGVPTLQIMPRIGQSAS